MVRSPGKPRRSPRAARDQERCSRKTIHDLLRWQVRESRGRGADPSAIVMDTQTVHASVNAPKATTGLDPGTKSRGRERGIATDVLGLLIAVIVVVASVHDNAIGIRLLDQVAADNPSVAKGWVDAGFKNAVIDHGAALGIDIEVVQRDPHIHLCRHQQPRRRSRPGRHRLSRPPRQLRTLSLAEYQF
ncbi:transposase [Streptomyces sp. NPDC058642]|uniref:transposase n=1 Tax=Streptomyces sp. NPDC058642 TaxID=3346572 RepID=UPI0036509A22